MLADTVWEFQAWTKVSVTVVEIANYFASFIYNKGHYFYKLVVEHVAE